MSSGIGAEGPTADGPKVSFKTIVIPGGIASRAEITSTVELDRTTFPLPSVDSNLSSLGKANWFTTIDLLQGFHQVELCDDGISKEATAFSAPSALGAAHSF